MMDALAALRLRVTDPANRRSIRRGAASAVLLALLCGYGAIFLTFDEDAPEQRRRRASRPASRPSYRRSLSLADAHYDSRLLAKNGESPAAVDEIPGEFIVKPWVGVAATDVWEEREATKLTLMSCQASSTQAADLTPRNSIDDPALDTRWASRPDKTRKRKEWLNIDMGVPQSVAEFYIRWHAAYAVDYQIQVSRERQNCRPDGSSCPDGFVTVVDVKDKADETTTRDAFESDDHSLQGVRYVRLKLTKMAPNYNYFSVHYFRVYRKQMIVGEAAGEIACGDTLDAAATALLAAHGGALITRYEHAEFFSAHLTEAQKDAMFADPCTFTVEPNYVVRARGRGWVRGKGRDPHQSERQLAIPEFNLKDENPPSWGLQRISSHGKLNGMYIWFHEGLDTHLYIFDTGVYPDHSDWNNRNGTSRLAAPLVCAGEAGDYALTDHGTHIASLAGGFSHGVAKSATIHPIQVLDRHGEGSTASVLCGVERLLQDGKAFNAAHAPEKIRAVVNLSFGVNGRSDALDKAVKDMTDVGYTVVIAAGDQGDNACFYSPYDASAITVGALSDHPLGFNSKTSTSNYGECIDLWGPGEDIVGASNAGEYESTMLSGTSVAAAFVAGATALFFSEINTEEYTMEEFSAKVKEKIINKAEVNVLGDMGHGSPNLNAQTTAARCLVNTHCQTGLTCLRDGSCADLSKPLK